MSEPEMTPARAVQVLDRLLATVSTGMPELVGQDETQALALVQDLLARSQQRMDDDHAKIEARDAMITRLQSQLDLHREVSGAAGDVLRSKLVRDMLSTACQVQEQLSDHALLVRRLDRLDKSYAAMNRGEQELGLPDLPALEREALRRLLDMIDQPGPEPEPEF